MLVVGFLEIDCGHGRRALLLGSRGAPAHFGVRCNMPLAGLIGFIPRSNLLDFQQSGFFCGDRTRYNYRRAHIVSKFQLLQHLIVSQVPQTDHFPLEILHEERFCHTARRLIFMIPRGILLTVAWILVRRVPYSFNEQALNLLHLARIVNLGLFELLSNLLGRQRHGKPYLGTLSKIKCSCFYTRWFC